MHRNPYLILGIPFGCSRAEANAAFAVRARALRRSGPQGVDQLTDLTWALQQIDEAIRNPAAAMELYRIPADPHLFSGGANGVLSPPPEHLPARPGDPEGERAELRRRAAHEYLGYLVTIRATRVRPLP